MPLDATKSLPRPHAESLWDTELLSGQIRGKTVSYFCISLSMWHNASEVVAWRHTSRNIYAIGERALTSVPVHLRMKHADWPGNFARAKKRPVNHPNRPLRCNSFVLPNHTANS